MLIAILIIGLLLVMYFLFWAIVRVGKNADDILEEIMNGKEITDDSNKQ